MQSNKPADHIIVNPEGPIASFDEDALDRRQFVTRLSSALVNRKTKRATGVVVGLTGPWGSGKTSILNLIEEQICNNFKLGVVIRFNPWLISGTNDLIVEFFAEMVGTIKANRDLSRYLINYDLPNLLSDYGANLSPLADTILPGLGIVAKTSFEAIKKRIQRDNALNSLRKELYREFSRIDFPIVILIDELDRVEDLEVHRMAQLIKAVADFPNVSYMVAYDAQRVAEALAGKGKFERGQAYLEKIVQFQIPLPILFQSELASLLEAEIDRLLGSVAIPPNWADNPRYVAQGNCTIVCRS